MFELESILIMSIFDLKMLSTFLYHILVDSIYTVIVISTFFYFYKAQTYLQKKNELNIHYDAKANRRTYSHFVFINNENKNTMNKAEINVIKLPYKQWPYSKFHGK